MLEAVKGISEEMKIISSHKTSLCLYHEIIRWPIDNNVLSYFTIIKMKSRAEKILLISFSSPRLNLKVAFNKTTVSWFINCPNEHDGGLPCSLPSHTFLWKVNDSGKLFFSTHALIVVSVLVQNHILLFIKRLWHISFELPKPASLVRNFTFSTSGNSIKVWQL